MTLHHQKFHMIVSKKPNEWKTQEFRVWKCISNKYFHEKIRINELFCQSLRYLSRNLGHCFICNSATPPDYLSPQSHPVWDVLHPVCLQVRAGPVSLLPGLSTVGIHHERDFTSCGFSCLLQSSAYHFRGGTIEPNGEETFFPGI